MLLGKKNIAAESAVDQYAHALAEVGREVYVLVRADDLYPLFISGNFQRVFGMPPQRLEEDIEALYRLMTPDSRRRAQHAARSWDAASPLELEFAFTPDGAAEDAQRTMRCSVSPVKGNSQYLVAFNDASRERERVQQLEQQVREATSEAHIKADFLNNMSHEIRTPLNGILGLLGLARERSGVDGELLEDLEQAGELGKYLLSLVNDILDVSRIESGKVELEHVPFDLQAFAADLKSMFEGTAAGKGIDYTVELQDCPHRHLYGDRLRLSQVTVNLISNAMKFTPSDGSVSVVLKEMYCRNDVAHLMIRVRDTGKGMSPQFLGRIFRPFEQEDAGIAGKYGGSGLGMAIADSLVKLMRGEIVVDSQLGCGSEFSVYIPFDVAHGWAPPAQEDAPGAQPLTRPAPSELLRAIRTQQPSLAPTDSAEDSLFKGRRVLVAEDNDINAKILTAALTKHGAKVERARDGQEAAELCEQAGGAYDVVLMDIQMPRLNGWEATQRIRARERGSGTHQVIVALSANAYVEDVRRSKQMGADAHMGKPVDFNELETLLRGLLPPQKLEERERA